MCNNYGRSHRINNSMTSAILCKDVNGGVKEESMEEMSRCRHGDFGEKR